ncbi:2-octaprenyl-3-methyl-6-methoxy-1,4-benzoquinol hydroxylase [uncultured Avibacterium sp.]|uniref:2-octaprenyl-3-methyl-6-methoxy-1,4-benzoquinol hydroxylase n=1 Tax=uncultured Avibacterium sp. TaxID=1936169 RepID=A0A486XEY9_9PAST|nr:2-octaprenyl-3-methyl-6-methoxy-1,4-benzoquinol hydroxylase [uncultured Avibacterium sp.]
MVRIVKNFDLIIIGGGMVGLALAAKLKNTAMRIALLEPNPPRFSLANIAYRVSALNLASEHLLQELNVWQTIQAERATAYDKMLVWEKDSFAKIEFDTKGLGISHLGHIVENQIIQHSLWQQVATQENVEIFNATAQHLGINESTAILTLTDGQMLAGKLVVGADGANSWLRQKANIPLIFRDYGQYALVCNVKTAEPHQHCARQIFAPDSILAFLPLHQENLCSIVWSIPPEQAKQLSCCEQTEFNKQLSIAFDNQLGLCEVQSERQAIPLTARYARNFAQPRIALIGDAAHTIHPLAGQGVNLGLQDALLLAQEIEKHFALGLDIGEYRNLRYYERTRKAEAVKMLIAMQGLKDLFAGSNPLKKLARGIGLSATNQFGLLKEQLIRQGLGI